MADLYLSGTECHQSNLVRRHLYRVPCTIRLNTGVVHFGIGRKRHPPVGFSPAQSFPNPFNPHTTIASDLAYMRRVILTMHDLRGRFVTMLIDGAVKDAGHYEVVWDGKDERGSYVPSGIYFSRFIAGSRASTQKMALLR